MSCQTCNSILISYNQKDFCYNCNRNLIDSPANQRKNQCAKSFLKNYDLDLIERVSLENLFNQIENKFRIIYPGQRKPKSSFLFKMIFKKRNIPFQIKTKMCAKTERIYEEKFNNI